MTAREEYIADLMERRVWRSHRTKLELAAAWDVSPSTIQNYSAAAGRSFEPGLREERAARAFRSLNRLEDVATSKADAIARVRADEIILKATGFDAPEERQESRPSTLIQVGTVVTGAGFARLLAGHTPKELNAAIESDAPDGRAEDACVVPVGDRDGSVDGDTGERS